MPAVAALAGSAMGWDYGSVGSQPLARVRATYPLLLPVDEAVASCYARLADQQLRAGRKPRRHGTWIAATAMRHNVAVLTQDQDFTTFSAIEVIHV